MFIDFFVKHPRFAGVCSIIIILAGAICIPLLPVSQYPQIAPPQITVTANYIGANAQVVESAVTTPLEQQLNGVEGMKYMTSSSTNDGISTITITFNLERNLDAAMIDVQNRVQTAQARLPQEVKTTGVNIAKTSSNMVLIYGLYTNDNRYDTSFMSNYADRYIKDNLKRIKGVQDITIFGERKFAMRLWLDPGKLASRNLTATDVVKALQEQNVQVAAGQIGQPPIDTNQAIQMSVKATGRLEKPEQFNDIVLKTGLDGSIVRLRDVGRAELGAETYSSILRAAGHEAVGFAVFQLPSANALDVGNNVKKEMEKLSKNFPPGLEYYMVVDATQIVTDSIREVLFTLSIAILLVIAVIYIFLQDWRTTLIPAITIPVSLIGTFAFLKIFGFSINTLTLFGITLATGLVVDDSIIVIENIERFIKEKGMPPAIAAVEAMKEIFGAVIATSLVLIAVFVPIAFFPGTTGQLYKQFALTIAFSIALSSFNAITLTPALSALLLGRKRKQSFFFDKVNEFITFLRNSYNRVLNKVIQHKGKVIAIFLALICTTYFLSKFVPSAFVPNEDQNFIIVAVQAPEGTSVGHTQKIITKIEGILATIPEIDNGMSVAGFSILGSGSNKGTLFVHLKSLEERKGKKHSANAVVNRLRGMLMGIPEAIVMPFEPPAIHGVGNFGGFQFEIKDEGNHDLNTLSAATQSAIMNGNKTPILTGLYSGFTANDPQLQVDVNRFKAKQLNVSLQDIYSTLQIFLGSMYVNDFDYLNRVYRVYVQADQQFRTNPNNINQFYVRSQNGSMIPLSNLLSTTQIYTPQTITHFNMFRSTEINGSAKPGFSTGQAIKEMEAIAHKVLPQGMTFEWAGTALEEIESGSQSTFIFILSFIFVYLILVAKYESFMNPVIILMAVPLAMFGAYLAQFLRGFQNDIFCQIGLVMLIGLAGKNAILIVEFANQLREKGLSIKDAAMQASAIRFRPIIMTSLAFILGIMPLVLATGAGSASRNSMGTAVVGGMLVSTVLNLLLIPVLYILFMSTQEKFKSKKKHVQTEEQLDSSTNTSSQL
ncbi:MAG: multidrug efflux RND transporter permease subunit [Candidatus Gastranaerophilales bacterium]|nr:multidrug efflux RND transporter permease subunit [Candidatus Gastranaerophilales bacterium]